MAPPKKDAKKDDKKAQQDGGPEAKFLEDIKQLEQARNDLQLEHTFLLDKFRQLKAENERLRADIDGYKARLGSATEDYADILEHRQEQIKAEESKLKGMHQHMERLEADIAKQIEDMKGLKEQNGAQAAKLDDAAQMLADKDNLEEAVRKQHDLIEKQSEELRTLKRQLEERDTALDKANNQIEELTLKSSGLTELRILFEEPWLVQVTHARLKGDMPLDREYNSLSALGLGKQLVLYGGSSKAGSDGVGREVAFLNTESHTWERPSTARTVLPCMGHSAVVVGRTKMLLFGGMRSDGPSADVSMLNTDTMKWASPLLKGSERPLARHGHTSCCIREKVFTFGGVSVDGILLNDLWVYDQDSSQWNHVSTFGSVPSPRKAAAMACTEDGRRLYVFGGNDGGRLLNDVYFLDLEKLTWSPVSVHMGSFPEPRENAVATITSKYLIISCGTSAVRCLGDTRVLDLYNPNWECLDDGAWANNMLWLKNHCYYVAFYGNKQYIIKPNMHDRMWELQITEWSLPEDIERLRMTKKRDSGFTNKLELQDAAVCGVNSLELSWRPPTKNAERVDRYKLMIATSTGVVKDAYQGRDTRYRVIGLKPNTEYIMCVKALYDDGSFLWSESKAYRTLT